MNKKAQINPHEHGGMFGNAHPVFIIGICVTVCPYIMNMPVIHNVLKITFPSWISAIGFVLILIGAVLSITKS